ncbi:MAG TPA: hypothetical protein VHL58_01270 [Thermoanaerobaculia bacterium]|nr:hypothetical protein [Thermoanaerobaculia bacterium]
MNGRAGRCYLLLAFLALTPFLQPLFRGEVFRFRDHSDYFVPLRYYTSVELRAGHLPLWNPYSGSGERWMANPQTGLFYPPSWIFLIIPFATAYILYLALHLFLLGAGAFRVFRWHSDPGTALLGATLVMSCGPILSLLDVQNVFGSVAWFPLVIDSAMRLKEGRKASWSMSVACLSLIFLAGEPFLAAVAWLSFLILTFREVFSRALAALTTALLLISVQLLPFLEMIKESERLSRVYRASAFRESISPGELLAAAVNPGSRSNYLELLTPSQHFIPSIYLGSLAILLACLGTVATLRRKAAGGGWLSLCVISTLLAAAGKVETIGTFTHLIGMDLNRYPAKLLPIAAFAFVAMAVIGARAAASLTFVERSLALVSGSIIVVAALGRFRSEDPWTSSFRLTEALVLCVVTLAIVLLRVDWLTSVAFKSAAVVTTLLLGLFAAHGMLESVPFSPSTGFEAVISSQRKVARLLPAGPGIIDRRAWMSGYTNLFQRVFDAGTAAPVVPSRYLELHDLALRHPRLDILDWLSVGYVFAQRDLSAAGYTRLTGQPGVSLYLNRGSLPMLQFSTNLVKVPSDEEAYSRLISGSFDVRKSILVSGDAAMTVPPDGPFHAHGVITRLDGTTAGMKVETDTSCLVILNQLFAEGWRAEVDGQEQKAVIVNGLFRGIVVAPGSHRVLWKYRPVTLFAGAALSLSGVIMWILLTGKWSMISSHALQEVAPESQHQIA